MKRFILILLAALLVFSQEKTIFADEKSIRELSEQQMIDNKRDSIIMQYGPGKTEARVIYGTNGIDIITGQQRIHLDTSFPVDRLAVMADVNGDGYSDFATYQLSSGAADNLFVLSGKDGSLIWSGRYTKIVSDNDNQPVERNTAILQMQGIEEDLLIIADYSLIRLNGRTGEKVFEYRNEDNIWKFLICQEKILFTDQLGCITVIDSRSGSQISRDRLADCLQLEINWGDPITFDAQCNLWDIYRSGQTIYLTSENGKLYFFDINSDPSEAESVDLNVIDEERIKGYMINQLFYRRRPEYRKSGIYDMHYMGFRIIDENSDYLLISCYLKDNDCRATESYNDLPSAFAVYNKAEGKVETVISYKEYAPQGDGLLAEYDGQKCIVTVYKLDERNVRFIVFDYEGNKLAAKDVHVGVDSQAGMNLSHGDEGYLLEIYNGSCCLVNSELEEAEHLYDSVITKVLAIEEDRVLVEYLHSGISQEIVCLSKDMNTEKWRYQLQLEEKNKGFEFKQITDYNGDGINDIMTIVNRYDDSNQARASHFIFIDGNDGSLIQDKTIYLGRMYDENGKPYKAYLVAENFNVLADLDKDGKRELEIGGSVISSKTFTAKGYVSNWIDANGKTLEIGDVNGDGFTDYVSVSDKKATQYLSSRSSYSISYKKSKVTADLNEKGKNSMYGVDWADLDNDGVKELVFLDFNEKGYQVFAVYNGATLNKMLVLKPTGIISDYQSICPLGFDCNGDGYNDIIEMNDYIWQPEIVSGADGRILKRINPNTEDDEQDEIKYDPDSVYHPENLVPFSNNEKGEFTAFPYFDLDNDGLRETGYMKMIYDYETYTSKTVMQIYSGRDLSPVRSIELPRQENAWQVPQLIKIKGNDQYCIMDYGNQITVFDCRQEKAVASVNRSGSNFIVLDDRHMLMNTENSSLIVDFQKNFEMLSTVPEQTDSYRIDLSWKPLSPYSTMSIYDNGRLIYTGNDQQHTVELLQGEHTITLSLADGFGKSSSETFKVEVAHQPVRSYWLYGALAVVVGCGLFVNLRRKLFVKGKLRRAGK